MSLFNTLIKGAVLPLILLAGCGGDDGDSSSQPPTPSADSAEGLWIGSTDTGRSITGLVLSDGTYYVLYSAVADPTIIAGVVQGTGTSNNGSFTSTNARDFNIEGLGVLPSTISASYFAKQSLNGTLTYTSLGNTNVTFTSIYDAAYELTPSLAALAGTYTGQVATSLGVENATTIIDSTGNVSGISQTQCTYTGTASPITDGNAFNISVTFGGAPCLFANQTLNGIAYYDESEKRLYAAAPNASRSDGILYVGVQVAQPPTEPPPPEGVVTTPAQVVASFNPSACQYLGTNSNGDIYAYCGADAVADFSIKLSSVVGDCTVSKTGGTVTLTQGASSISAILDAQYSDAITNNTLGQAFNLSVDNGKVYLSILQGSIVNLSSTSAPILCIP